MRRVVSAVAAAASLVLVLAGCTFGGASLPADAPTESVPTGETVAADLARYYHQVLHWTPCEVALQCSTAIAPLNWADPDGAQISLALIRSLAKGTRMGSLLVNPGGPGVATKPYFAKGTTNLADSTVANHYDIVGFDVRGVGDSTSVKCGTAQQLDSYLFDVPKAKQGTDAWFGEVDAAAKSFGQACLKATGALLGHVGAVDVVKDMDMLRAALGDTVLHYVGFSYGTLYGQLYAQEFPTTTGRLVLDGVVDPTETIVQTIVSQAKGFESALRAYVTDCLPRSGCPFSSTVDAAMAEVGATLTRLDESPLRNSDGRMLGSSTFYTAIILPLYTKSNWGYLDQLFSTVRKGDPSFAFSLADSYYDRDADGTYLSNKNEAFQAALCLDDPATASIAETRAIVEQVKDVSPLFGADAGYGAHNCAFWPEKPTLQPGPITAPGSPDILVVGTTDDPATPFAAAQKVASSLVKGHLLTYRGEGHTAYGHSNDCVDGAVDAYLIGGTLPADGATC